MIRGVTLLPDGTGGYTVDDRGGLHPFAVGPTDPVAPATTGAATLDVVHRPRRRPLIAAALGYCGPDQPRSVTPGLVATEQVLEPRA